MVYTLLRFLNHEEGTHSMRILVVICLIVAAFDIAGLSWSSRDEKPDEAYMALTAPPTRTLQDFRTNAYFVLLGFTAAPSQNPLQVGLETWLEAEHGEPYFNYDKEARSVSRIPEAVVQDVAAWPVTAIVNPAERDKLPSRASDKVLQSRYQQLLTMPFEDRGYGIRGRVRFAEVYVEHRRYLAAAESYLDLADRLEKDIRAWRTILANARTLNNKIMAAAIVNDDLAVLVELSRQPDLPKPTAHHLGPLVRPMNEAERSLRLPMQNEFVVGVQRFQRPYGNTVEGAQRDSENMRWNILLAKVEPDAFARVELTPPENWLVQFFAQKQRTLNTYARYYEAAIKTAETMDGPMPKLHDYLPLTAHSFMDHIFEPIFSPIDSFLAVGKQPVWEPFMVKLRETDTRLRLATLQAILRPVSPLSIQQRMAQAGTTMYDPFSGLPMLWNPGKGMLYSVGRNNRDDGGNPELDIVVQPYFETPEAPQGLKPVGKKSAPSKA